MTVQEFFNKYNGKGVDFDGYYGFQCMDLAEQYNKEVVGAPRMGGNAADTWTQYPASFYDKIPNTPSGVPQPGDIMIWNRNAGGGFGHIAIVQQATVDSFTSFDQNWPTGSISHFQPHNYNNVYGWLHPKNLSHLDLLTALQLIKTQAYGTKDWEEVKRILTRAQV